MLQTLGIIIAISGSLGVLLFKSPLNGAISMVSSFIGVALIFSSIGAHFLAVSEIAVYAGAILVLVLFVLMLLNIKGENVSVNFPSVLLLTGFVTFSYYYFITFKDKIVDATYLYIGPKELGDLLLGKYIFHFELLSLLLLVGIIASMHLVREMKQK